MPKNPMISDKIRCFPMFLSGYWVCFTSPGLYKTLQNFTKLYIFGGWPLQNVTFLAFLSWPISD